MKQQGNRSLEGPKQGSESRMSSENSVSEFTGDELNDFNLDIDDYMAEIGTITNRIQIKEQVKKLIKQSQDTKVLIKIKN
jgi:hypothetical protein